MGGMDSYHGGWCCREAVITVIAAVVNVVGVVVGEIVDARRVGAMCG